MKTVNKRLFCHIAFFVTLLLKVFSQGFTYFPVLDDYIQYGGYPLYDKLSFVYLEIGTVVTRPFASLADPALWGQFYPHLWVVLLIICFMFFTGTRLIDEVFKQLGIHITPFLYAVVLLIPLGFEGTYWISASSRICVGIFFSGLASCFLVNSIRKSRLYLIGYIPCTLLSFGFYESVMVMSAILQFAVIFTLVKSNKKRFLYLLCPVISGMGMVVYYKLIGNVGALGSRANGFSLTGIGERFIELITQYIEIIVKGGGLTTAKGALEGLKITFSSPWGIVALILAVLLSAFCGYFGGKLNFKAKAKSCVPFGIALIILPLIPNTLSAPVWLTYRSVVVSFFGLVLVSAPLFALILKNQKARIAVIFLMVLLFSLGNINELDTYRHVHETDDKLVTEITRQLDSQVLSGNKETIVVLEEEIITPQVSYYKDHVKSVFDSDWALTGAVRAKARNVKIKMITPVFSLDGVDTQGKQIIYIGGNNEK